MNTTAAKLQFHRVEAGQYQADTNDRRYLVTRVEGGWTLRVRKLLETAGVKHTIGLSADDVEADAHAIDTKTLAVDVARRYEQLIADGYGQLFTDLKPMTRAVCDAYEAGR